MAQPAERELTREQHLEKENSDLKQQLGQEISRRKFLYKVAAGAAGVVLVGGYLGKTHVEGEVRGQLLPPGELSPDLRTKLETAGYFVPEIPAGLTIAKMRAAGLDISPFPFVVSEGQPDVDNASPKHNWMAIKRDGPILPSEEDATPRELGSLVNRQSTEVKKIADNLQVGSGDPVELIWFDHRLRLATGEGLFNGEAFVITATKIKIDGKDHGIAIGRREPGGPIEWSIFDASSQEPVAPPDKLAAVAVVVEKP